MSVSRFLRHAFVWAFSPVEVDAAGSHGVVKQAAQPGVGGTMTHLTRPLFLSLSCILIALAGSGEETSQREPRRQTLEARLTSFEFRGGSLRQYVTLLKERNEDVNVVIDEGADAIVLPAMSLKNVTAADALRLLPLTRAATEHGLVVQATAQERTQAGQSIFVIGVRPSPTAQLRSDAPGGTAAAGLPNRQLKIFALGDLTDARPGTPDFDHIAQTLLDAARTALAFQNTEQQTVRLQLHAASGLLMAYGTPDQVGTVSQVFAELSKDQVRQRGPTGALRLRALEEKLAVLQQEMTKFTTGVELPK
jgi:hypothetical protein